MMGCKNSKEDSTQKNIFAIEPAKIQLKKNIFAVVPLSTTLSPNPNSLTLTLTVSP